MKLIVLIILVQSFLLANSQEFCIENNQLLNFLYKDKSPITTITNSENRNLFIKMEDSHLKVFNQVILKKSNELYILIQGTGRVYKAKSLDGNRICFDRIDSTHFYGYNISCMYFSVKDILYSFGGGGFWKENGQLRYFSDVQHEWGINLINKEIAANCKLFYVDHKKNIIYYLQTPYKDASTGYEFNNYIITKLNIDKKENTEIGQLPNKMKDLFIKNNTHYYSFINMPSLNGALLNFNDQHQYLINYEKNEVYKLVNPIIKDIFFGSSKGIQVCNTFESKNIIYYTKFGDSTFKVYSFPISMKDFVKEPYPLYDTLDSEKTKNYSYIGGIIMLLIGGSIFYVKKKKRIALNPLDITSSDINKSDSPIEFNPLELELINKMAIHSRKGDHFSVEDINAALGLNKKTLEIQKKIRTETINRINHKFKIKYNSSAELIERIRSEEDRRFYKYKIIDEYEKIIGS